MTLTIAAVPSITSSIIADGAVNPGASIAASPATYPTSTRSMSRGCGASPATPISAIRVCPFQSGWTLRCFGGAASVVFPQGFCCRLTATLIQIVVTSLSEKTAIYGLLREVKKVSKVKVQKYKGERALRRGMDRMARKGYHIRPRLGWGGGGGR